MQYSLQSKPDNFAKYLDVKSELLFDRCFALPPALSIMIPTYKRPILLKEAITSACNQQSNVQFEVVIVDNDPESNFVKEISSIISDFNSVNIRYYRNKENIGMFGNWNRCIELARAPFYTILNDDDLIIKTFVDNIALTAFDSNKLIASKCKRFTNVDELPHDVKLTNIEFSELNLLEMLFGHYTNGSLGSVFNRSASMDIGGYDESFFPNSDYFFSIKYIYHFGGCITNSVLGYARWFENESLKEFTIVKNIINDYAMWNEVLQTLHIERRLNVIQYHLFKLVFKLKTLSKVPKFSKLAKIEERKLSSIIPFWFPKILSCNNWLLSQLLLRLLKKIIRCFF